MKKENNLKPLLKLCLSRARGMDIGRLSVMIAYYAALSLAPMLMALFTLLPYFHISSEWIEPYMERFIPEPIYHLLEPMVASLLTTPRGGLLTLGALGTIWSAGKGVNHIQLGMDRAYCQKNARHYAVSRVAAVGTLIALLLLLLGMLLALGYGRALLQAPAAAFRSEKGGLPAGSWLAALCVLILFLLALYRIAPNLRLRAREIWPGALLCALGFWGLAAAFSLYLRFFASSLSAYGLLGGLFLLLVWLRALGFLLLMGAVLNAALYEQRHGVPLCREKESRLERWLRERVHSHRKTRF